MEQWVNVRTLGVTGDGKTDDTEALQAAVASRVLYFPTGSYIVRDTIALKPDTVLIALHPGTTRLDLPDSTRLRRRRRAEGAAAGAAGRHQHRQRPRPSTPARPTRARPPCAGWPAESSRERHPDSLVRSGRAGAARRTPGPGRRRLARRGRSGAQYPSIWVTRGGGGTFPSWSANPYARSGFDVSDTTTPGVRLRAVGRAPPLRRDHAGSRRELGVPRTADRRGGVVEPRGRGPRDHRLEANHDRQLSAYRVTRSYAPFPAAIRVYGSSGIRLRNVSVNAEHGYAVCDDERLRHDPAGRQVRVRQRARGRDERRARCASVSSRCSTSPRPGRGCRIAACRCLRRGRPSRISRRVPLDRGRGGGRRRHALLRRSPPAADLLVVAERGLEDRQDAPLDAVNLGVDRSGHLMVLSSAGPAGTVYALRPDGPRDALTVAAAPPGAGPMRRSCCRSTVWVDGQFRTTSTSDLRVRTLSQMFARRR